MRTVKFTMDQVDAANNLVSSTHTVEIADDVRPFDAMTEFMNNNKTGACCGEIISVSGSSNKETIIAHLDENVTVEYVASCGDCNTELNRWDDATQSEEVTCHVCGAVNHISNEY